MITKKRWCLPLWFDDQGLQWYHIQHLQHWWWIQGHCKKWLRFKLNFRRITSNIIAVYSLSLTTFKRDEFQKEGLACERSYISLWSPQANHGESLIWRMMLLAFLTRFGIKIFLITLFVCFCVCVPVSSMHRCMLHCPRSQTCLFMPEKRSLNVSTSKEESLFHPWRCWLTRAGLSLR